MKNILVLSVFPAPYRVNVFKEFEKKYNTTIFFERIDDKNRSKDWFLSDKECTFYVLQNEAAIKKYNDYVKNLNQFKAVFIYDYSTFISMKLMIKCILKKVPYAINCDGAFINKNIIKLIIKRFFITRATACLAGGDAAEKYFSFYGAKDRDIYRHNFTSLSKEDILKDPLSVEEKNFFKKKVGLPEEIKIVLSIGQFAYRKGFDILLKSWLLVQKKSYLIIIGGGEEEKEYKKYIIDNNLENIEIKGYLSKDEIFDYYKAADLFVLPTREDIWGLVINEAMACGLPVVTTNKCIAGVELIEDYENGFIVPVDNEKKLAEKINMVLSSGSLSLRMSQKNLEKIREYTIEKTAMIHIEIIEDIIKRSMKFKNV